MKQPIREQRYGVMMLAFVAAALSVAGLNLPTQNLKGEPRVFPADVAQRRAVVVLTFSKSQALSDAQIDFLFANPAQIIPEPGTLSFIAVGLLAGIAFKRRRNKVA